MSYRYRLLTACVFFMCLSVSALCEMPQPACKAAIVMEYETGRTLFEYNADELLPIASTTKIMTCLLALENCKLDETVTASRNASGVPGTSIYLSVGEQLSMEDMLYGLMLRSGNDAAVAIAEHVAGDVSAFSEMMNARAAEMGVYAHFTTPNGLDSGGNGASARAITEIARHALKNDDFRKIVSTKSRNIPWVDHDYKRVLTNKNKLLSTYPGAMGVKTGYTSKAGRCLVFAAERDGMLLVGSVLGCPDWFNASADILDYAFSEFSMNTVLSSGETVYTAPVENTGKTARLALESPLSLPLKPKEAYTLVYEVRNLKAPVRVGDAAGEAKCIIGSETVASGRLIVTEDIIKPDFKNAFASVLKCWTLW